MMLKLIDTHVHLEQIDNLERVLSEAKDMGVISIVSVGSDLRANEKIIEISQNYREPEIYLALGLHPWNLDPQELGGVTKQIEENIDEIVAVGEIGLDFWLKEARREGEARNLQRKVFESQLDLALNFQKPVIIHSRGAWRECLDFVLKKNLKKVIFHWYSGPLDILKEIIRCGYLISATPACEYSKEHREVIKNTPLENLILETDSPVFYKTYESQPKDILRVLKEVAILKGLTEEELTRLTTENTIRVFDLNLRCL